MNFNVFAAPDATKLQEQIRRTHPVTMLSNNYEWVTPEEEVSSMLPAKLLRSVDLAANLFRVGGVSKAFGATASASIPFQHFDIPTSYQPLYKLIALERPKLVIFDKDGTLICFHEMWIPWALSTAESLRQGTGLSVESEVYQLLGFCPIQRKVGPGLLAEGTMGQIRNTLISLLVKKSVAVDKAERLVEQCVRESFKRSSQSLRELQHLHKLFVQLKRSYLKIAICTADNRDSTVMMLRQTGVEALVDDVMCGDDLGSMPKPHPHNALTICKNLGVDPEDAIMVGDTIADLGLARSAGLGAAVGVLSGVGNREHLEPHADILLDHVGDLITLFGCHQSNL